MPRRPVLHALVAVALAMTVLAPAPAAAAAGPDMTITKSASAASVPVNSEFTYTIVVRNQGTAAAQSIVVRDPNIDPQLQYVGHTSTPKRDCTFQRGNLVCRISALNPGASVRIDLTMRAVEAACSRVLNRANVSAANEPSANASNNTTPTVRVDIAGCPADTQPPTGSVSINRGGAVAYGPRVLLNLSAIDRGTPVAKLQMRISNSPQLAGAELQYATTELFKSSRSWILTSPTTGGNGNTGVKTVYVQFRDKAGNWSAVYQDTIRMTRDAPNSCAAVRPAALRPMGQWQWEQVYPRGDSDWFKYRLASRRSVSVTLASLPTNYRLELFNSSCTRLAVSNNRGTTSETITRTLSAGTYFVRVSPSVSTMFDVDTYAVRMRLN